MIRATTGGVLRSYRKNLMNSFISQNKARDTVLTQRNFNSYAEDPAAAAKCFRLRKSRMTVEGQIDVCSETYHKFEGAYQCLQSISQVIDTENAGNQLNTIKSTTLRMLNDPSGDARTQLSKALDQMSENLVQNMNQTYGDVFIFAGADGHNVPFEIKTEDGQNRLYYRGVPVDAAEPALMKDGSQDIVASNGELVLANATLVEQEKLPDLELDANDEPITILGTDDGTHGQYYYLLDGAAAISADDFAQGVEDGTIKTEDYVQVSTFTPPLGENTIEYYRRDQIISKDEYDKVSDSIMREADGTPITAEKDGKEYYIIEGTTGGTISQEDYDKACLDVAKLETLAKETQLVDIGLGFQEDKGKLIESSAFNAALQGITFLGYGVDQDGDPKNVYSIVQRLKEIADSVPDGEDWDTPTWDEFDALVGKLEKASSNYKTEFTNFAAGTTKLKTNLDLLDNTHYNLQEQYAEMEDVNAADAISAFIWAQYSYNAALKVGNSILSESLMDYLR